jgi:hypothetical protein
MNIGMRLGTTGAGDVARALPHLQELAPGAVGDRFQPAAEVARLRVVGEVAHLPGQAEQHGLGDVLRIGLLQS